MLPNPQTALTVAESLETLETSHSKSQMLETYRGHLIQTKTGSNDNDDDDETHGSEHLACMGRM